MSRLKGQVIVITGGAGLIGRSFVQGLLEQEAKVVIAEKNVELASKLVVESQWPIDQCMVQLLDITNSQSVSDAIESIIEKWGYIDSLVNNAYPRNSNYGASLFDVQYEDFCENLSMNVGGYFLCMQQFAKYFKSRRSGSIVNIASIYGSIAPKFEIYEGLEMTMPVEYSAIKSSLIHLTKYMAKALKGSNVRVNCLSPGGIYDNHADAFKDAYSSHCLSKGMLDARDLNGTLIFLLTQDSKYVNGQNIVVDDGFTL